MLWTVQRHIIRSSVWNIEDWNIEDCHFKEKKLKLTNSVCWSFQMWRMGCAVFPLRVWFVGILFSDPINYQQLRHSFSFAYSHRKVRTKSTENSTVSFSFNARIFVRWEKLMLYYGTHLIYLLERSSLSRTWSRLNPYLPYIAPAENKLITMRLLWEKRR